ncbi:hypothetical protein [Pararhodobacter sp.]|uniref:hypothetical protein n=1 Tax=Pararhodobacter sp. TaxID=2127056 RepID=UPI002AFF8A87|nr:hypothetical protein [Pararhodobacter sp.]
MLTPRLPFRKLALLAAAGLLSACANGAILGEERAELGDFRLCYNIVTINDAVQGPLSREADLEEFSRLIRAEVDRRFGRYDGDRLYHIAMHLDAYVLAVPGIPIVASPRSALIISTNVWDDVLGRPLNDEPEQFTVLESASGTSLVGSGLTQTAEQQMQVLAQNAAIRIENWLAENPEWFQHGQDGGDPAVDAEADSATPPRVTRAASSEAPEVDRCASVTGLPTGS